jgi:acyl-CoA thioesterase
MIGEDSAGFAGPGRPEARADGELVADTAVESLGAGRYRARVTDRWSVGVGPNGGYLAAILLRAVLAELDGRAPVALSAQFLERPFAGPAEVVVEVAREGRRHAVALARLVQEERPRVLATVTVGVPAPADEPRLGPPPPLVPPPGRCAPVSPRWRRPPGADPSGEERAGGEREARRPRRSTPGLEEVSLWDRLEFRVADPAGLFFFREAPGPAATEAWVRLADGGRADALAVPVFLDGLPPALFSHTLGPDPLGAPTLEIGVHWRDRVGEGWHYARLASRLWRAGYVEEDGELWSEDGRLVAMSRQLAIAVGPDAHGVVRVGAP